LANVISFDSRTISVLLKSRSVAAG
jgi:hypothetical protein